MTIHYSDIVASLSLLFASVIGILNYLYTKKSVRNSLSPYLTIRANATLNDKNINVIKIEVQNLHHEIIVEDVTVEPTFIAYNLPNFISYYRREQIYKLIDRLGWYTRRYSFDVGSNHIGVLEPKQKMVAILPLLEGEKFWLDEDVLYEENGNFYVKGIDINESRFHCKGFPHLNFDLTLRYVPAVYPVIPRKEIYKYHVTAYGDSFPGGKLKGWIVSLRENVKNRTKIA